MNDVAKSASARIHTLCRPIFLPLTCVNRALALAPPKVRRFAGKLAVSSRARLFTERRLQVAEHEASLGAVHGGPADANVGRDILSRWPRRRRPTRSPPVSPSAPHP